MIFSRLNHGSNFAGTGVSYFLEEALANIQDGTLDPSVGNFNKRCTANNSCPGMHLEVCLPRQLVPVHEWWKQTMLANAVGRLCAEHM